MKHLVTQDEAGWVRVVIDRQQARNALNTSLLADLAAEFATYAVDPACRAVLVHGAGGNFAAGADIGEIETKTRVEGEVDARKAHWASLRAFPKPVVAAVDGFALGGGLELALIADLLVVGQTARLGLPETNLGLIPGAGGGQRLMARIGPARAARMILTGEIIDAATAYAWGLASHIAEESAVPLAEDLTTNLARRAPLALAAAKASLVLGSENVAALQAERTAFEILLDSVDKLEGIQAFREKRKPEFRGQ
ncbi:enoyl-CoA hydratase-related protein [Pararhizobium sp. YC-54]|uniref:enoyl-CoA hydratase-related protein n=1 Tax=Pararhizobium sp. YC-54 TaxID=2986920 RepID=UPI0021F70837|nr:enoyl-CoA hydratase-related protein [Pararhizobium sp. YC-54]MCV9999276.1 enoyl-CoA hydratase-related protein [Pararhizobium sp. YC-54]